MLLVDVWRQAVVKDLQLEAVVDNFLVSRGQNTRLLTYFTVNNTLDLAFDLQASQANIHCYCQLTLAQCWVRWEVESKRKPGQQEAELCHVKVLSGCRTTFPVDARRAFSRSMSLVCDNPPTLLLQ